LLLCAAKRGGEIPDARKLLRREKTKSIHVFGFFEPKKQKAALKAAAF